MSLGEGKFDEVCHAHCKGVPFSRLYMTDAYGVHKGRFEPLPNGVWDGIR